MRKKILTLLVASFAMSAFAHPVSLNEAQSIAFEFFNSGSGPKRVPKNVSMIGSTSKSQDAQPYYVFNAEGDNGFVIVSGDDRTPRILGYADQGGIDTNNIPVNFQWLLDYYEKELTSLALTDEVFPVGFNKIVTENRNYIDPLIETNWGQYQPYNINCPSVQGHRCLAGCVATAMAQVINYHSWPQTQISEIAGYTTSSNHISMPGLPPFVIDWNNINASSIARLMLYCGQSVRMDYDPNGSGAVAALVPEALINVFGYSNSATHLRRCDYSEKEWDSIVYDQISNGLPVLYSGQSPTVGGHTFIVDGYELGKYHINWGWEGNCDGFFTLDRLDPFSDSGFTESQEMTINVNPPAGSGDTNRPKVIVKNFVCKDRNIERKNINSDFQAFELQASILNDLDEDVSLKLGLALYDDNGLVKILSTSSYDFSANELSDMTSEITITADIPQGEYRIVSVSRSKESEDWVANSGSSTTYVKAIIEELSLQLKPFPLSEEDRNNIDYGIHTIDGITYLLRSENNKLHAYIQKYEGGGQYKGDIYIPDNVIYQNMNFTPYYGGLEFDDGVFYSNDEIISISTPIELPIMNCSKLKSITFRDKCTYTSEVNNCQSLETIIFSDFCGTIGSISNCPLLKSLSFNTKRKIIIIPEGGSLWNHESLPSLTDIYFNGDNPPMFHWWCPDPDPEEGITIHIPQGTLETYKYGGWSKWNLKEDLGSLPAISTKWDYCGDYVFTGSYGAFVIGCGTNDAEYAMRIPADHLEAYKNCKITAIEYVAAPDKEFDVEYVFITSPGIDYIVKESVKTVQGTWMRVELPTPYTITGEDIFVGAGRHHAVGAIFASDDDDVIEDGLWARNMGSDSNPFMFAPPGSWCKNLGNLGLKYALPIRAIIEGETLPNDIVIVSTEISSASKEAMARKEISLPDSSKSRSKKGDDRYFVRKVDKLPNSFTDEASSFDGRSQLNKVISDQDKVIIKVRNRCPQVVKKITLDWDINGIAQTPIIIQTGLPNNYEEKVVVDMPKDISGRYHKLNVSVSDIDGKPDEITANSEKEEVIVSSSSTYFPRKYVLEEATGTWCGYCPIASASIDVMKELYPDNFIAIAIHNDDMEVKNNSYDSFKELVFEFPSAWLNRTKWLSNWGPIDMEETKDMGEAQIKSTASFGDGRKINVCTETEFGFSDKGDDCYRIAYVVLEDNVGPYFQTNYYSNPDSPDNPDDYLNWWIHQSSTVLTTFNDVARGIYDYDGIQGQFPENIIEGETYANNHTLTLPNGIQDASNLKIATLLIDTRTGEILNADCTRISGEVPDLTPKRGDSNGNGEINIVDAINIANYLVGKNVESFFLSASDVNEDGTVSISDASATVSMVLEQPATISVWEIDGLPKDDIESSETLVVDNYSINSFSNHNLLVALESSADYVAIQGDITFPAGMLLDDIRPAMGVEAANSFIYKRIADNTMRFVLFNFDNKPISVVGNKLLELSVIAEEECFGDIRISNVIASDAEAHEFLLPSKGGHNSNGLGIKDTVEKDEFIRCTNGSINIINAYGSPVSISTADGRLLYSFIPHSDFESITVASGIYIVTVGRRTLKVIVK